MRLLADECVAGTIVERLRSDGFDIVRASDIVAAVSDEQVLATAHQDGRVLITGDRDLRRIGHTVRPPERGHREPRPWRVVSPYLCRYHGCRVAQLRRSDHRQPCNCRARSRSHPASAAPAVLNWMMRTLPPIRGW